MGLLQNTIVAVVEETVEGTLESDVLTDAIKLAADAKPPKVAQRLIENPEMSGSLSPEDPLIGPDEGSFDIPVVLKGSGYCDAAPEAGALLKALFGSQVISTGGTVAASPSPTTTVFTVTGSDFEVGDACLVDVASGVTPSWEARFITAVDTEAITVAPALSAAPTSTHAVLGSVTYKLSSDEDDHTSVSVYYYLDGILLSLAGCRGNVKFDFAWGEVPKAVFSMELGSWVSTDEDCGYTPSYDSPDLFVCSGGSFTVDGSEEYIENLSLDLGLQIAKIGAIQSDGYYRMFVSKREPSGSFDPYASDDTHLTAFKAGTPAAALLSVGSGNNIIMLKMPRIMRNEVNFTDKEGVNTYEVNFKATKTSGDDEIYLSFLSNTATP